MARKEDVFVKLAILGLPIKDWSLAILTALRHSSFSTYLTVGVHRFWILNLAPQISGKWFTGGF
jgi:hypothetical protein